jgi:mycofactocin radical SAM maturase
VSVESLVSQLKTGLDAPICLTWELTYGCNLACVHCLSSSGRRDPRELSTAQAMGVIDQLRDLQVFYVNIGGGEPTIRSDFYELVEYAVANGVGVKFSTNGTTITPERAERLAGSDYIDVQISIDGATAATNDPIRGEGVVDRTVVAERAHELHQLGRAQEREAAVAVVVGERAERLGSQGDLRVELPAPRERSGGSQGQ